MMLSFKQYLKEDFEQLKELKDFKLEVVRDEKSIAVGLSGRTSIAPDGGMLFILPESKVQCFWMANCLVEMDIIFLDSQTRVTAMHRMKVEPPRSPYETNTAYENRLPQYSSGHPAQFVVELAAGTLDRLGIRVNSRINLARYLDEGFRLAWWYNVNTKKFIEVAGRFSTHSDVIFAAPEKLGLTEKDTRTSSGRPVDPDVTVKLLKKRGWAELSLTENVTSRGQDEANIRTNSNREAQGALKWILNTFRPSLERVFISNLKSPKNVILQGGQIDQFVKTGKVTQLTDIGRTMARFR